MADTQVSEARRILHFDGNASTRKVTTTGLRLQGFSVHEATTLDDALAHAQAESFVAAVVDCSNAEAAEALVEAIAAMESPVPIVLVTNRSNRVPFVGAEAHACLVRPFATPALALVLGPLTGTERPSVELDADVGPESSDENPTPLPEMVKVGEYQLLTEIARGGMGAVYVARRIRDAGVNRLYALKLLHQHLSDDEKFVSMLRDEASLASRINHQNVVSVNDVGSDDGQHFIVMDYVEGLSLSMLTKRKGGSIPEDILASIFVDTLEGLHGAHSVTDGRGSSLDLVHRDVSPENILVGTDGAARISDFGVAKARIRLTHTLGDERKGKIAYLSPEQLIDDETVDRRVDVWAAGVALWGALTGESLFARDADSEAKILRKILDHEVPPPSTAGRKPNPFLDAVVLRALERDVSRRYQTAREMSEAIRKAAISADRLASKPGVGEFVLSACALEVRERREIARMSMTPVSSTSGRAIASAELDETRVDPAGDIPPDRGPAERRVLPFFLLGVSLAGAIGLGWYLTRPPTPMDESGPRPLQATSTEAKAASSSQPSTAAPVEARQAPGNPAAAKLENDNETDGPLLIDEPAVDPDDSIPDPGLEPKEPTATAPPRQGPPPRRRRPRSQSEPAPQAAPDVLEPKPKPSSPVEPAPKDDPLSEPNPYR